MTLENDCESRGVDRDTQRRPDEALDTISKLAANITRELRTPLNELKSTVYQLVRTEYLTPQKLGQGLGQISRLVDAADSALKSLTDAARLRQPDLQPIDLNALTRDVLAIVQIPHNVNVSVDFSKTVPHFLADESQIEAVMRSLIQNAIDAMPNGGRLAITSTEQSERVAISVSDTGKGISHLEIDRIMTPLYTTFPQRFGLGLAVSKSILEMHGGTLSVRSKPNVGSEFIVELPIRRK